MKSENFVSDFYNHRVQAFALNYTPLPQIGKKGRIIGGNFDYPGNIAIGPDAMKACSGASVGNVAIGYNAGTAITSGDDNVLMGYTAGDTLTTGAANTCIGYGSDVSAAGASNQQVFGNGAVGHGDNIVVLGSTSVTAWHPPDDNGVDLGATNYRFANLYVADMQLSNENTGGNEVDGTEGSWSIQEGEDDLYLLNRKSGKKYRFKLEEIT